jgi:hypothetical protein
MSAMLCLTGSEKAKRIAVARKLDALDLFQKNSPYQFGIIKRPGQTAKNKITFYGEFALKTAVDFIQRRLADDADTSNPIVAVDRHVSEAIRFHVQRKPRPKAEKKEDRKRKRGILPLDSSTLGLRCEALLSRPSCPFVDALRFARTGFYVFPVHSVVAGICSCRWGRHCKKPGSTLVFLLGGKLRLGAKFQLCRCGGSFLMQT